MNERRDAPSATLVRVDLDGTMTEVLAEMTISNGLAWSPDGRTMYHADTPTHTVRAFDYDPDTGVPSRPRVFAQWQGETDRPDGGTVDSAGNYWTAFYRGGKVLKIAPSGETLAEYAIPAMCPTMCAFGGPDLKTLFVTTARQNRDDDELARLPHSGGLFAMRVDVPGLPETPFAGDRARAFMLFDPAAFLRLDVEGSLGATGTGASFATSTGDMLDVTAYPNGAFRVRLGPNTRPDYGIVVGRARACTTDQPGPGTWTFADGDAVLELQAAPMRFRLLWKGEPVLRSITDEHFRGWTRLPSFGRSQRGGLWTAALALQSGEPVYGLGEKFGPLDKRGQLIHSQVEDALGVNTGLAYKNVPFAWGPGTGTGAWGVFVHTPGMVTHGVGHPDWSHRSYGLVVDDEALDLFLFAAETPAGILDAYTLLTGRAPAVPRWSLGLWVSRAYYKTPEEAVAVAQTLRERRIPCDVLTLDGRAAWKVETRFNFEWDPERFADPRASLAAIRAHHLRVCVWEYPYVSVHAPLFVELATQGYLLKTAEGDPYVFSWDLAPGSSPFGNVLTPLPESGILDFTNPEAYAWWRDAHQKLFDDGVDVDQERLRRARARRRRRVQRRLGPAPAQRVSAALQPLRLRGDAQVPAERGRPAARVEPRGLGGQPAVSDGLGRRPAERLGRPCRVAARRPVARNERQSVPQLRHRRLLRRRAAVGGALRALAAGDRLLLAHPRARHRRARAVGVRPRDRGDLPQVARVPVPAHSVPRVGHRARRRPPACP